MHHIWRLFLFHYNELTITTTFHQVCVCVVVAQYTFSTPSLFLSSLSFPHTPSSLLLPLFLFLHCCLSCPLFFFPFSCTSFPFFLSNSFFLLFYLICTNFSQYSLIIFHMLSLFDPLLSALSYYFILFLHLVFMFIHSLSFLFLHLPTF